MLQSDETKTFFCTCSQEIICLTLWEDFDDFVGFSIFDWRGEGNFSWRIRLEWIWRILTKGYPYLDDITLSREDVVRLRDTLSEVLEAQNGL